MRILQAQLNMNLKEGEPPGHKIYQMTLRTTAWMIAMAPININLEFLIKSGK